MRRERKLFEGKLFDSHTHCEGIDIYSYMKYLHPTVQDVVILSEQIKDSKVDCALVFPVQSTIYYNPLSYIDAMGFCSSNLCDYPYEIENKRMLLGIQKFEYTHLLPFISFSLNDKVHEQIEGMLENINKYEVYGLKYHTQTDRNKASRIDEFPELVTFIEK